MKLHNIFKLICCNNFVSYDIGRHVLRTSLLQSDILVFSRSACRLAVC